MVQINNISDPSQGLYPLVANKKDKYISDPLQGLYPLVTNKKDKHISDPLQGLYPLVTIKYVSDCLQRLYLLIALKLQLFRLQGLFPKAINTTYNVQSTAEPVSSSKKTQIYCASLQLFLSRSYTVYSHFAQLHTCLNLP